MKRVIDSFIGVIDRVISFRVKRVIQFLFILGILFLIFSYGFLEYSSTPKFCVTCHYMKPYYNAWKTSSHNKVPCIECHYPPTPLSKLEGKFRASVQLVKYITRQYGTKPWTEIDDSSCLRPGCHEKRLLKGKVQFQDIVFDHTPHLTSFRRVTGLRCTSCHAQIVQGTHMTVTLTTCFLCHFKNIPEEEAIKRCTLCHKKLKTTSVISKGSFDHNSAEERGIDCILCHTQVVKGDGSVPKERCLTCHSELEKINKYKDIIFMHRNHVTKHKVDCIRCHLEIQHILPEGEELTAFNCNTCHPNHHKYQKNMYLGKGAKDVKEIPSPMFKAHVSCSGCHIGHKKVSGKGEVKTGELAACMACHGEKYGKILSQWTNSFKTLLDEYDRRFIKAENELNNRRLSAKAKKIFEDAKENFGLFKFGNSVHNIHYSKEVLRNAIIQINSVLELSGSSYRLPLIKEEKEEVSTCLNCHSGVEYEKINIFGVTFEHKIHVIKNSLNCETCHSNITDPEVKGHGSLKINFSDCLSCHQKRASSPHSSLWIDKHKDVKQKNECVICHREPICSECHRSKKPSSHKDNWIKNHTEFAKKDTERCGICHKKDFCFSCHKIDIPHPDNWLNIHKETVLQKGKPLCLNCHKEDFCKQCH